MITWVTGFEYSPSNEMTEIQASSKWSYIVESSFNCFPKTQPAECVWVAIEMAVPEPRLIMHVWCRVAALRTPTHSWPGGDRSRLQMLNVIAGAVLSDFSSFR